MNQLFYSDYKDIYITLHFMPRKHINAFDWIPIPLIMSDAIANFYSKPSGQKCAGSRQMGGAMSQVGKYGIPLWAKIDNKIGELIPSVRSTLDGSDKIGTKINKNVRSLGDKRALENQGEIPTTKTKEYVAPKHKAKKKKRVRYTKYDDSDDKGERYKRYRRDDDTY